MVEGAAYLNGDWIDARALALPMDDLGVTLGAAVVERLRTFNHRPFAVDGHVRRLRRSLEIVGWDASLAGEVEQILHVFVARNAAAMAPGDDWAIVALVTPGKTADAAQPTVCVYGFPLPFAGWAHQFAAGVPTQIVDVRHVPANCLPPELKCRSRMHYYLAEREAERREAGARAILLDQEGRVAESTTANVVCYFEGRGLVVPRVAGVLPGISQEVLADLAAALGWSREEADLWPRDLYGADEVFLASTSVCVLPVVRVDGQPIGSGRPGPAHRELLEAWGRQAGVDVAAQAVQFANR